MALAGVDVEAAPRSVHASDQRQIRIRLRRPVSNHRYPSGSLSDRVAERGTAIRRTVGGGFERDRIAVQAEGKIFAASAAEPLWRGSFHAPVPATATDSFGTRRMFNGKLASVHKGADFRAATGTPVRASNSGAVVLARPLYYEGNCVIIDHGMGLFTLSMHFSRIDVRRGSM